MADLFINYLIGLALAAMGIYGFTRGAYLDIFASAMYGAMLLLGIVFIYQSYQHQTGS